MAQGFAADTTPKEAAAQRLTLGLLERFGLSNTRFERSQGGAFSFSGNGPHPHKSYRVTLHPFPREAGYADYSLSITTRDLSRSAQGQDGRTYGVKDETRFTTVDVNAQGFAWSGYQQTVWSSPDNHYGAPDFGLKGIEDGFAWLSGQMGIAVGKGGLFIPAVTQTSAKQPEPTRAVFIPNPNLKRQIKQRGEEDPLVL